MRSTTILQKDKKDFLLMIKDMAEIICPKYNVPPQVCVAQAMLETGWGRADRGNYNYFGIKGEGTAGSQIWTTKEYRGNKENGYLEVINDKFAVYRSLEEGIEAYCLFVLKERYNKAKEWFPNDPTRFIVYIWACGYATDINYPMKIFNLMKRIYRETGDESYNKQVDAELEAVVSELQTVPAGPKRRSMANKLLKPEPVEPVKVLIKKLFNFLKFK